MVQTLIPIDFNSLNKVEGGKIKLSNYYIDYAFTSQGLNPSDGLEITFYDKGWIPNTEEIICLDGILRKDTGLWFVELVRGVYTLQHEPHRKYFSSFIGADTKLLEKNGTEAIEQKLGDNPSDDTLSGVSCFVFASHSNLPDFSNILGVNSLELNNFFQFTNFTKPHLEEGKYSEEILTVRGGANRVETS